MQTSTAPAMLNQIEILTGYVGLYWPQKWTRKFCGMGSVKKIKIK
uniref:Uncharacterized protein n=1 Tax=Romanomermis culicivorax TaxID=13658 RepID=A0A915HRI0_ROMCU